MGIFDRFKRKKEKNEDTEAIISKLGCDCEVILEKEVKAVMARYQQAFIEGKKEGYTPIIIIPSEMMLEVLDQEENVFSHDDPETIIAKSEAIDAKELLKKLLDEAMPGDEVEDEDVAGEFQPGEPQNQFLSIQEALNKQIIIAKIPTENPWEAAAWIPMGGFNDCPMPEEQVAVFKYWYEKYGAVPALATPDVWELYVGNPPKTQEESQALAWEQFGFCGDIVWQGTGTVNSLAGTLMNSSVWFFWWD